MKPDMEVVKNISAAVFVGWPIIVLVGGLVYLIAKDEIKNLKSKYSMGRIK